MAIVSNDNDVDVEVGKMGTVADMDLFVDFVTTGMGFFFIDLDGLAGMIVGVFTSVVT